MAIYHCSISNVSRASGSSSCANLAYISGEKIHDERIDTTYNFSHKDRILETGTIIPDNAPNKFLNPSILFNELEKFERADNARTAKKIQVALPKELNLAEQKKIVEDFIKHNLIAQGYCATYAIHDGGKNQNYHAHILVANRPLNSKGEWDCKRKMSYALDSNGNRIPQLDSSGKQKVDSHGRKQWKRISTTKNLLDDKNFLLQLRKNWADEVNKHLSPELHIDHRSNSARGLIEKPTIHEGYAARAIERKGQISDRCQLNRDIKKDNAELKSLQRDIANKKQSPYLIKPSDSNLANAILNALNVVGSLGEGGMVGLKATAKKDYKRLLENASSPEEVAKILAEIEELEGELELPSGSGSFVDIVAMELEKEREIDERIRRRKRALSTSTPTGSLPNSRPADATGKNGESTSRHSTFDDPTLSSTGQNFESGIFDRRNAETERAIEDTEREIARLSQEREETARRQRESEEIESPTVEKSGTKKMRDRKSNSPSQDFNR